MEQKNTGAEHDAQRERMIAFILKVIQQTDDRKLRNIYNFVLHIN